MKPFLQSAFFLGGLFFVGAMAGYAADNITEPNHFITHVMTLFHFPDISNAVGATYFVGGIIGLLLITIIIEAIINTLKDLHNFKSILKE